MEWESARAARRGLVALLLAGLSACNPVVYDDGIPAGGSGGQGGNGGSGGAAGTPSGYVSEAAVVSSGTRLIAAAACQRLWSDCHSICDNIFVTCGNDEQSCIQDYATGWTQDLSYPMIDLGLAQACAHEVSLRSCNDLDPRGGANATACDDVIVESCPGDTDGYAQPYSWRDAAELSLPGSIAPLHLCPSVPEWFHVQLEAGATVVVQRGMDPSSFVDVYLYRLVSTPSGDKPEQVSTVGLSPGYVDTFPPVVEAGSYYLQVETFQQVANVELLVGTESAPPPLCSAEPTAHNSLVAAIAQGNVDAFALWMRGAERPLRSSLRRFAAVVDTEAVVQETLLRIWQVAPRFTSDGRPQGLLRLSLRIAHNLAVSELRRLGRRPETSSDAGDDDALTMALADAQAHGNPPPPDPLLRARIDECRERLPAQPRLALGARLAALGNAADATLAQEVGMQKNTFLQNITRARRLLAECLRRFGIDLADELAR